MRGKNPYDELYKQYDMINKPFGYSLDYILWRHRQLKGELAKYIDRESRILDVGGGTGIFFQFLNGNISYSNYFNSDYSFEMLKKSPFQNINAVGDFLPFKYNSFDYVVCSEVLEHVIDKVAVLNECYKVLKEDGLFLLTTPRTGWIEDFKNSPFVVFWIFKEIEWRIKSLIPKFLKEKIKEILQKKNINIQKPSEILDEPSDEKWLNQTMNKIGFIVLKQYRGDNHFPFAKNQGESKFWRWFSDTFVNERKYGHCTIVVARKKEKAY